MIKLSIVTDDFRDPALPVLPGAEPCRRHRQFRTAHPA